MLKIEIDDQNTSIVAAGDLIDLVGDIGLAIEDIYDALQPEAQSIFRCLMTSMVTNDQSSLWSGKNAAIVRDCTTAPKKEEK